VDPVSAIVAVITITADGLVHVQDGHGMQSMSADYAQMYYSDLLVRLLRERATKQADTRAEPEALTTRQRRASVLRG
jgi:hypothetical protein